MEKTNKVVSGLYRTNPTVEFDNDYPPRFCFIDKSMINCGAAWTERYPVGRDVLLILVKSDMDLTLETSLKSNTQSMAAAAAYWNIDYDLAWKQMNINKCIPGSVFMVPDGRLIWMSDIDFKYFEEVEL